LEKHSIRFMGLDLAGSVHRPTGWAIIDENLYICEEPGEVFSDEQILEKVDKYEPHWIGIDAPLSFPKKGNKTRLCDRELRKFNVSALSPFFIASLTKRGIMLCRILTKRGYSCIEVYPRATQKILGITVAGKKSDKKWCYLLQRELSLKAKIKGLPLPTKKFYSSHVLDAILCAYTAWCRWKGIYQEVGNREGKIVIPLIKST